jgi:hypothetical protein
LPLPSARSVGSVPATRSLSCFALPLSCKKNQKLTSLFSHSSGLLKEEHSANSLGISGFRSLLQNTGGVPTAFFSFLPLLTIHNSLFTNSFRICTSEKQARKPFRIRSSKTRHLKSFRIRIYKKKGVGAPPLPLSGFPAPTPDRSVGARFIVPAFFSRPGIAAGRERGIFDGEEREAREIERGHDESCPYIFLHAWDVRRRAICSGEKSLRHENREKGKKEEARKKAAGALR